MGKVFTITSGKGGTGKSTISSNLAVRLSATGNKVILLEMDFGLRNLDLALGCEDVIVYNLIDVIEKECPLEDVVIHFEQYQNLDFLAAPQTREASDVTPEMMIDFTNELKKIYDYILIDSPAGIGEGFHSTIPCADMIIIVVTPDNISVRSADKVISILKQEKMKEIKVLVNRYHPDRIKMKRELSYTEIAEILPADIIGILPDDYRLSFFEGKKDLLSAPDEITIKAFDHIVQRINGQEIAFLDIEKEQNRFSRKLKRLFNRNER